MKGTQEQQVKTKNNSKAMLHFIAIVLTVITIVSLAIGLFAWSKYTASINGNANVAVAKWNFNLSLKSGSTTVTGSDSLNLASTQYETSSHIANGKIAPGTSGEFDIVIDTRGTEVSMLYDVTIGMSNCPRNITFSKKGPGENSFTVISPMQTGDTTERTRTISFSKYLTLNDVTTANTNDTTFVETIKWEWPYELATGTDDEKTAYDNRDKADSGITATLNITAVGEEMNAMPVAGITKSNYGQYVDLGTNILDLENIHVGGQLRPEADWRVFNKDSNGVWLILAHYMPNSAFDVSKAGLEKAFGTYSKYGVRTTTNRINMIDALNGNIENKSWNDILIGSRVYEDNTLKDGVQVKGAVNLETWIDSWNAIASSSSTIQKTSEVMDDGVYGYYNPGLSDQGSLSHFYEGLFFTGEENSNGIVVNGYWLGSPSANNVARLQYVVGNSESIYQNVYYSMPNLGACCGVRPVVYLPNNIKLDTSNTVWTIAE